MSLDINRSHGLKSVFYQNPATVTQTCLFFCGDVREGMEETLAVPVKAISKHPVTTQPEKTWEWPSKTSRAALSTHGVQQLTEWVLPRPKESAHWAMLEALNCRIMSQLNGSFLKQFCLGVLCYAEITNQNISNNKNRISFWVKSAGAHILAVACQWLGKGNV